MELETALQCFRNCRSVSSIYRHFRGNVSGDFLTINWY